MKRFMLVLVSVVLAASVVAPVMSSASKGHRAVLEFDVMAPVVEPYTGTANPIRDVPGGGLPWEIDSAKGELRPDGKLEVEVEGLVLARRAPVPEAQQGTNPVPSFKAIVSCLTSSDGAPTTTNVATDLFPATTSGDSEIEASVPLPSPCFAPIVFVASPNGAWFSVTGI